MSSLANTALFRKAKCHLIWTHIYIFQFFSSYNVKFRDFTAMSLPMEQFRLFYRRAVDSLGIVFKVSREFFSYEMHIFKKRFIFFV